MKRRTRSFIVYILSPLIAITVAVLKSPLITEADLKSNPKAYFVSGLFLIIATAYTYYVTIWSPYNQWKRLKTQNWGNLATEAKQIIDYYVTEGFVLSMNIMIPKRRFFYFIEPSKKNPVKTKFSLTGKVLHAIWSGGAHHVKRGLKFTVNQGACGIAYTTETITAINFPELPTDTSFNLTESQTKATKDIVMLVCFPIVVRIDDEYGQEIDIWGVLSIESKTLGSEILLKDPTKQLILYDLAQKFMNYYIKLQ